MERGEGEIFLNVKSNALEYTWAIYTKNVVKKIEKKLTKIAL